MKRAIGAIVAVILGAGVIALVGLGFQAQKYQPPDGILKAQSCGSSVVNGQSTPHVILHFSTWPDASGKLKTAAFTSAPATVPATDPGAANASGCPQWAMSAPGVPVSGKTVPIHPGGNPSYPAYAPSNNFQVPAGALVTVVWDQYDSGGSLNNNFFATPHGTYGKVTVNGKAITAVAEGNVAHTFTVRAEAGVDSGFFLSVASPVNHANKDNPNDDPSQTPPQVVEFSFIAGKKGLYAWNCEFPCGMGVGGFGAVMSAFGYMSGYLHVV